MCSQPGEIALIERLVFQPFHGTDQGDFLGDRCAVRASDHYGWQEGEPTPVGGFPATPTPVPVTTSFIEPNYYPDYDRITPPEEAETAPKTNAGSLLPQFALAAVAVGSIAVALKRTK